MSPSTTRRRLLTGAGATGFGAISGCFLLGGDERTTVTRQFPADDVAALAVDSATGSLTVRAHDGDAIQVQADKRAPTEDGLDAVSVAGSRDGDRFLVQTERDADSGLFSRSDDATLHLTVEVPEGISLERAATRAGSVTVEAVTGPIEATADGGDVYVGTVEGAVDARTRAGDVTVRDATGTISARTEAGDVTVDGVIGTLRSDAGEIRATVRGLGEDPAIRGAAANVALAIAGDLDVTVEADVDLGDLDVHGDGLEAAVREVAGSARVVVGDGDERLVVETDGGELSVTTVGAGGAV